MYLKIFLWEKLKPGLHLTLSHMNIISRLVFSNCIATKLQIPYAAIAINILIVPAIIVDNSDNLALSLKLSCFIIIVLFIDIKEYNSGEMDITLITLAMVGFAKK